MSSSSSSPARKKKTTSSEKTRLIPDDQDEREDLTSYTAASSSSHNGESGAGSSSKTHRHKHKHHHRHRHHHRHDDDDAEITGRIELDHRDASGEDTATAESDEKAPDAKDPKNKVSLIRLFQFSSWLDRLMILVAIFMSMAQGALTPVFSVLMGNMIGGFTPIIPSNITNSSASNFISSGFISSIGSALVSDDVVITVDMDVIMENIIYLGIIGSCTLVIAFAQNALWSLSALSQATRIRKLFFRSIMSQEIGWHDLNKSGELNARISGDTLKIQEAFGEKLGVLVQNVCSFIAGWIVGLWISWRLALVIIAVTPLLVVTAAGVTLLMRSITTKGQQLYSEAGAVAQEVLSCMRTVTSLGSQKREERRYEKYLISTWKMGKRKGIVAGLSFGFFLFIMLSTYALGFWYGSTLVNKGITTPGDVMTVFFAVMMGAMAVGQIGPDMQAVGEGQGAAYEIFNVIGRTSQIDALTDSGEKPSLLGNIDISDVHFSYPSRPDVDVLNGISISIKSGQTVALVGPSGCGKSTIISLLQRFYNSKQGSILFDGHPIESLSVPFLRSQMGVVGQEPVLFPISIRDNIALGCNGDASFEEVVEAAKKANAHHFISQLPDKYGTLVGERGVQLSGGQKQRIAIARAIVRNPAILLLDEATSALDTESELVVQDALEKARQGRTTIVIAHRLSTIQSADNILVIDHGSIVESGTHSSLIDKKGLYHQLVMRQQLAGGFDLTKKKSQKNSHSESAVSDQSLIVEEEILTGDKKNLEAQNLVKSVPFRVVIRALLLMKPTWGLLFLGVTAACILGVLFPAMALIFSEMVNVLVSFLGMTPEEYKDKVLFWVVGFIILGVTFFLVLFTQSSCMSINSETLTRRLRSLSFSAMLRQEIGWFDDPQNSTGVLTTRLSTEATLVDAASGGRLASLIQSISSLVAALGFAFFSCWQLALAVIGCFPFMAGANYVHMKFLNNNSANMKKAYEDSGQVAWQAVDGIRTVAMIGQEKTFIQRYSKELEKPITQGRRAAIANAVGVGVKKTFTYGISMVVFYYGGILVNDGKATFDDLIKVMMCIMMGTAVFVMSAIAPDYSKAKLAAYHIFKLLDRIPLIDITRDGGDTLSEVKGCICFKNVSFSYPTRPGTVVLDDFSLQVPAGARVALVGTSGCGKTTVISLLERFYDVSSGSIMLDNSDLQSLNIQWLRSQIGLVSQEPVLFGCSIKENIARGLPSGSATMEQIIDAAKDANAHDFIMALPKKYDTYVGEKGTQLSGGQKQRIAIARALIRNPKILLLDEATSALDTESEAAVQEALERVHQGRTTIVVAHRLSTVQNSDQIIVISKGKVVETGTHQQLLEIGGEYARLANNQALFTE
ncbi:multidrug resistance protein 1 [Pelomyxa schiedti]|nr:multidrug resistance protein 1 [Pelomyxa schiedti]